MIIMGGRSYGKTKAIKDKIKELEEMKIGSRDIMSNTKGICEDCGKKGIYRYEPYEEEIHEKEIIMCLCDDCYNSRAEEI